MTYEEAKRQFGSATLEQPSFIHLVCYDQSAANPSEHQQPWAEFDGAVIGFLADPCGVSCLRVAVLEDNRCAEDIHNFMEHPVFGEYFSIEPELVDITNVENMEHVQEQYQKFQDMHLNESYIVYGVLYGEDIYSNDGLVYYQPVEGTAIAWDVSNESLKNGAKVLSVDDAFRWVLENHPAYLEGITIMQNCPDGNWLHMAAPANFIGYPEGTYETHANRMKYAQQAAEEWNVELGSESAEDVLNRMREVQEKARQEQAQRAAEEEAQREAIAERQALLQNRPQAGQKSGGRKLPYVPEVRTGSGGEEYQAQ